MDNVATWTAIGAAVSAIGVAITSIAFVAKASFHIGRISAIVENGMTKTLEHLQEDIIELFRVLKDLPCKDHEARGQHRDEAIRDLKKEISKLL